jgi:hypothetical protein
MQELRPPWLVVRSYALYHSYFSVSAPNRDEDVHHPKPIELIFTKITLRDLEQQDLKLSRRGSLRMAPKAHGRCWEAYRRCCITGIGGIAGNNKPVDVDIAHIFPYAHRHLVRSLLVQWQSDNRR